MAEKIRKADIKDLEPLMRFLEKSYGHRRNYFLENYAYLLKDVFGADKKAPKGSYIVEKNGKILSHVGLYPIEFVSGGVKITACGIGNVATHPEARGRGCMRNLLQRAIRDMEEGGVQLSVLWGDRQRYGNFGWELAGEKINLSFSARSFAKAGVRPVKNIEEVEPGSAVREIKKLHKNIAFRAKRGKKLKDVISRNNNRVWLSREGYLCGADRNELYVNEVYSRKGNEAGLILSAMKWAVRSRASLSVCPRDYALLDKLIPSASSWDSVPEGMFRVNSWGGLLDVFSSVLKERAVQRGLGDFSIPLEIECGIKKKKTGIIFCNGEIRVMRARMPGNPVKISEKDAVRLFLGGPVVTPKELDPLKALLPIPVHLPSLDHV